MKDFFDHNMPRKLCRLLKGHYVSIALEMGCDTSGSRLALVVLSTNNWNIIRPDTEVVVKAVNAATPASFEFVMIQQTQ